MKWYHPIVWYFAWWEILLLAPAATYVYVRDRKEM